MKKLLSLVLSISLMSGILSGCATGQSDGTEGSSNPQDSTGPVTITIWHDKEDAVVEVLENTFASLAPDVVVNLEKKTNLTEALKMVGNDPNAAPDMYLFAHDKLGVYAEMGILAPITDFLPQEVLDEYMPMTLNAATYKGDLYQLPIYFETLLFLYNRRYMDDSEVPATTEELYSYMETTTRGGHYGFVEQHSTAYYAAGWIHGFGGSLISQDGVPGLNSPETIAALEYHKKFVDLMPTESEYATINTLFTEGKAHSTIGGPWMVPTVRASGMDLGLAPMPVVDETGLSISPFTGVQGVHVLKIAAECKFDAVTQVLTALTSTELGAELALASGCAPAKLDCYDLDEIAQDEMVMCMKETAENAVPMPNIPEMDVMFTVTSNLLVDVNMSGKDIASTAESYQQKALDLIEQMK